MAATTHAPKPPGTIFRVVKKLESHDSTSGVYLCLPRILPPPFTPSQDTDGDVPDDAPAIHAAYSKIPRNQRLRKQMPLLQGVNYADFLYRSMEHNGTSLLLDKHLKMLPQLVVVKLNKQTNQLRSEVDAIEAIYKEDGSNASLFIGSFVLSAQHTMEPKTSFMCLRPVFGPNLEQFGGASITDPNGGIPAWFVGHIILRLIETVNYLHDCEVMHGNIAPSNIMLNLYPTYMHLRYRGYPDVLLINFSQAGSTESADECEDVIAVLRVMEEVITL